MKVFHNVYPLVFFLLVLSSSHSFSQRHRFTPVPPPVGGWGSNIISASQDPKGYMWFGAGGLHRYDGYSFKSYYHDPMNPSSLAYNRTEVVVADRNGFVWVGTNGMGLDRLDSETGIFTHFRHTPSDPNSISDDRISAILEDRDGKIWVGTEHAGLNCIDPKKGTITRFRHNPNDTNSLSYDKVTTLYEDREGTIWIGTGFLWHGGNLTLRDSTLKQGGLNRFNRTSKNFTRYVHDPMDPSSLIDNRVKAIFEDSKGTLWVGTSGDGLHTMNREKGSFERHRFNALDPKNLSRPPVKSTMPWADDMITFIKEDAAGTIWIGTLMGGLNHYDPQTRKIDHFTSLEENSKDKEPLIFWGSFTSKDGVIWFLTWEGVYRMDPFRKQIPHYDVGSLVTILLQDKAGKLWLGSSNPGITNVGLICYEADRVNKKTFVQDASDLASLSSNIVYSMLEDSGGTVWIGTQNGLSQYDRQTQKFTRYLSSGHNYGITALYEDRAGSFWLGTNVANEGLVLMNRKDGTFTHYKDTTEAISTMYRGISCIKEDKAGNLWLGTFEGSGGLKSFDRNTKKFQHYIPGTNIWGIFEDADGMLWIGTAKGLYYFDRSNNRFVLFYNQAAGLTENIEVNEILQDNQQSLWVTSSVGLFRLRHSAREISFFGERQGINPRSNGLRAKGGEFFFGSDYGYYAFFPEQLTGNTIAPDLNITGFRLGDQLVSPGKGSPLSLPISQTKEIHLSYNENVFSLDFAGIHYSSPEDNSHLFMLENLDNGWRKAGDEKTAYYYNVVPGEYVLRVKAANSDGIWAEKSIAITISPPWWKTVWAYFMYGVLFMAGVLATHRIQKKRVLKVERERSREKELAQAKEIEKAYHELKTTQAQLVQREKMASLGELTAGIAHEIQNPLNFINNFSELNKELLAEMNEEIEKSNFDEVKSIANNIIENEDRILHHGIRADGIVKGMLQHSKSSSGVKERTDINALADEYLRLAYHGFRAKDKSFNVNLNTNYDQTIDPIEIIPQDIGRVILNLFNNAFYAVSAKASATIEGYEPTVRVSTRQTVDTVEVCVSDNGNGISPQILDKIFQPFFTTKPTGQGTGLGLSLSYDIIKAHGGELSVETTPAGAAGKEAWPDTAVVRGEGATFVIKLPIT